MCNENKLKHKGMHLYLVVGDERKTMMIRKDRLMQRCDIIALEKHSAAGTGFIY